MKTRTILVSGFIILLLIVVSANMLSQRISTTKHNLSAGGSGSVKASTETEICIFCHTPHSAKPRKPLWNRDEPGQTYKLYSSSTMNASPGQPDGSSPMCLSCHDGTIALGKVASRTSVISFISSITTMPTGNKNLKTDLSDDHPISFNYNDSYGADGQLKAPTALTGVVLENGKVQCRTCHDPHYSPYSSFLIVSTQGSALCLCCHQKTNWTSATHYSSTRTWNGTGTNPWPHTSYTTVANNGCESCHNPHNAKDSLRLMNQNTEENNCLVCHNGNVTSKNVGTQFQTAYYKHNVANYSNIHDPMEAAEPNTKHVECEDCHNPHQATSTTASAPYASGKLKGVRGVDKTGSAVASITNEYELCFRCHSSKAMVSSATNRRIVQNNTRLEFYNTGSNPSYHAVAVQKQNNQLVPSLISPWTTSSWLYCRDCHSSSVLTEPAGTHGSPKAQILKYTYVKADNTSESASNYALCYLCHDRNTSGKGILRNVSFKEHNKHIVGERTPCNVCHDPHGISSSQGNTTNNSHLINFDTDIVTPYQGRLEFNDTGDYQGNCWLTCHGEGHDGWNY